MKHAFPREDMVDVALKSPYQEPNTELSVGWLAPKKRNPVGTGVNVTMDNFKM